MIGGTPQGPAAAHRATGASVGGNVDADEDDKAASSSAGDIKAAANDWTACIPCGANYVKVWLRPSDKFCGRCGTGRGIQFGKAGKGKKEHGAKDVPSFDSGKGKSSGKKGKRKGKSN